MRGSLLSIIPNFKGTLEKENIQGEIVRGTERERERSRDRQREIQGDSKRVR